MLEKVGFQKYGLFRKYIKKGNTEGVTIPTKEIFSGTAAGFYELMRGCFDVYTDLLPEPYRAERYLAQEICYSLVDEEGEITGGTVISQRGSVATEEFVFVKLEARGRGIARRIREYSHANASVEITQFVSWVRDNNEFSWKQLLHLGYKESNTYKITMMKG